MTDEKPIDRIWIKFQNGEVWSISAVAVAVNCALHHVQCFAQEGQLEAFINEFNRVIRKQDELVDWMRKMRWEHFEYFRVKVGDPDEVEYKDSFCVAKIVDVIRAQEDLNA